MKTLSVGTKKIEWIKYMEKVTHRWMAADEVGRISEIDRTEVIRTGFQVQENGLQQMSVVWDAPAWDAKGDHPHSVHAQINFCRAHLDNNGRMFGAFVADQLVGVGLTQLEIRPQMAQLAFLHVSRGFRRKGIGEKITQALLGDAQAQGAEKMYVSATPSGSAVGFYLKHGFKPVAEPLPELFAAEPEDIHMIKEI